MNKSLDKEFKPSNNLKKLYSVYLILGTLCTFLSYLPIYLTAPIEISILLTLPILLVAGLIYIWIPLYCDSITYKLTNTEIVWKRGVWFRNTGIVPYKRITNIDTSQGPISRWLKIASLKVQTAGYSGTYSAEIRLNGIEKYEELREKIMGFVRKP